MKPFYGDGDLRRLLAGCVYPNQFDARALPEAFRAVVEALTVSDLPYAVVGQLALARYCRARCTDRIEVHVATQGAMVQQTERLPAAKAGELPKGSTVALNVSPAATVFEHRFIAQAVAIDWLGTRARLATAEHLLWLALSSRTLEAEVEAVHLIQSQHVDLNGVEIWCRIAAPCIGRRFAQARRRAAQTVASTYSASVERRLAKSNRFKGDDDR